MKLCSSVAPLGLVMAVGGQKMVPAWSLVLVDQSVMGISLNPGLAMENSLAFSFWVMGVLAVNESADQRSLQEGLDTVSNH